MSIEPPSNFSYDSQNQTLHWDGVSGAFNYEILYMLDIPMSIWEVAYTGGIDTQCSFDKPPGRYKTKGRSSGEGGWGVYCDEEFINIS